MIREYIDKNGDPVECGCSVRIKFCDGPYGQTQTVEGVIEKIDQYSGAYVRLATAAVDRTRDGLRHLKPGDGMYVPLPYTYRFSDGKYICSKSHNDYEHGHEAWVEVLGPPPKDNAVQSASPRMK